jgi:phage terminase large subunit-like protein
MARTTRSTEVDAAALRRLKLSPEVAWYLESRGYPLPDCPPLVKTPEPRRVSGAAFDPERVDRVLRAFKQLRHTQGRLAGQPLAPDPWQVAYVIAPVFGWVRRNEHGVWVRIARQLYVDVPRKNGKTTLSGGFAMYLTAADGEQGAQVLAAATTKDQAGFTFAPVKTIAEKAPALKGRVRVLASKIIHPKSGSYFQVISSVADAQHGANVHGAVIDELHVHKTADLVEAIETGTGSREQPLIIFITTADSGKPGTIYSRKRDYVEKLAKGVFKDAAFYGVVWAASPQDDPFAEATWRKANPGFGISPTREYLQGKANEARNDPALLASFKRLHCGIRTKQETAYIDLATWDASSGMIDEGLLEGRACHGGIDLASVEDITALCWLFPPAAEDPQFRAIWRFWLPAERIDSLNRRTAGEAAVWVREGWLSLIPGPVIDNDVVLERILADHARFSVQTIGYDRWGAADLVRRLGQESLTCVAVAQTYQALSEPTKTILKELKRRGLVHGGNPVMRWMVDNLAVDSDANGNVKPNKAKAAEKIDGFAALVVAMREYLDTVVEADAQFIY